MPLPRLPKPRRRKLLAAAGATVAVLLALPFLSAYLVQKLVLPQVSERLGCPVTATSVRVWPGRVILRGVHVRGAPGPSTPELAVIPQVVVRYDLLPLLIGRVQLGEVTLDRPQIQVVRGDPDEDNVSPLLRRRRAQKEAAGQSGSSGGGRVRGPRQVVVYRANLDLRDDAGSLRVAGADLTLAPGQQSSARLFDVEAVAAGGSARASLLTLRFRTAEGRFTPVGLPEFEVEGGAVVPWKNLALTGISGGARVDQDDPRRAVVTLRGGYGGVDRQLWEAEGWVRPGRIPGDPEGKASEEDPAGVLKVRAARFQLSSLEPILKGTPVIDAERTEVDASLDLRYAQAALDIDATFHMGGLSLFTPKLAAEPVRGLGFDITAAARVETKTRRVKLSRAVIKWRGAEAILEAEAEAQPSRLRVIRAPQGSPPEPGAGPGWRERWRYVSAHFQIPPIPCQAALQALPPEITPHLRGFQLSGTFSTDIRVAVDFAQLLKLPPPQTPVNPDEEGEEEGLLDAAPLRPRTTAGRRPHRVRGSGHSIPPLRGAAASHDDPKGGVTVNPVTLSGKVGIDGCKVVSAPNEMAVSRVLQPFQHTVEVEPGKTLSFLIGEEEPDFVPFEQISPYLINSIMTTEDNGFMKHRGFIGPEFRSALQQNLERGYFRLGASSITMQMVKNVLLTREKTLSRKLQELFLTWYLEQNLTKERILEIYFNAIEFGPYLYGIGRATRHYFGKTPAELTPREAAWFSSILPNPKRRYVHFCKGKPDAKWEAYLTRILRRVHERGRLTDEEFEASLEERFLFNRDEAQSEKDCLNVIKRMTTPLPAVVEPAPAAP